MSALRKTRDRFELDSLAADLDAIVAGLGQSVGPCERVCLDVGARLGESIPGLNDLAGLFQQLSQSLESPAVQSATTDLQLVAGEIEATASELTGESAALAELVGLNQGIAERIGALLESSRTITLLVFNVKIEAASLIDIDEDMRGFVEGLHELAQQAQRALGDYRLTHGKLHYLLNRSSETQRAFQESHRTRLKTTAGEIVASVAAVAERRRQIVGPLMEISAKSQQVSARIGECVVALQVGDSTRQRIEHVQAALQGAADADAPLASAICRLQSLQLAASLDEFTNEVGTIARSLQALLGESAELANQGRALFGSNRGDGDSFLKTLELRLAAARAIIDECRTARAGVDHAAAAVSATMADLERRTAGLSEIILNVTMIGTNAILKSSRLGERGKGLSVIAQELRNYAARIVAGVEDLPAALRGVSAFVDRFSAASRARGAEQLTALNARMLDAIASFKASGETMADALARLGMETSAVRSKLGDAQTILTENGDQIDAAMRCAMDAVDGLGPTINQGNAAPDPCAEALDRMLSPRYTMESERQVHARFLGRPEKSAPASAGASDAWMF